MNKEIGVIKKVSYTVVSNLLNLFVTTLITFVTPKFLGIEKFGYFQLYLFYVTYHSLLQFGWIEGIILRYAGSYLDKLDRKRFSGQFWGFNVVEFFISVIVCLASFAFTDVNQKHVVILFGLSLLITLPRVFLLNVLAITNEIKSYAISIYIEKIVFCILYLIVILCGVRTFEPLIICDIIGRLGALLYAVVCCKSFIFHKAEGLKKICGEAVFNISVGLNLLFANIAGILIAGIVRMGVKHFWDISTFSKISLTLNISNLLMVFIRSVSTVLFPMLRRIDDDKLTEVYETLRNGLMIILLFMLLLYYPIKAILSLWLPQYAESLKYVAILFPMCLFDSKMSMLIETYMKALRMEKWLLRINATSVILSGCFTVITTYWLRNLDLAVLSIVILVAFRCIASELILSSVCEINIKKDMVMEIVLSAVFIVSSWCIGGILGAAIYLTTYCCYIVIKRKDVIKLTKNISVLFKRKGESV